VYGVKLQRFARGPGWAGQVDGPWRNGSGQLRKIGVSKHVREKVRERLLVAFRIDDGAERDESSG